MSCSQRYFIAMLQSQQRTLHIERKQCTQIPIGTEKYHLPCCLLENWKPSNDVLIKKHKLLLTVT